MFLHNFAVTALALFANTAYSELKDEVYDDAFVQAKAMFGYETADAEMLPPSNARLASKLTRVEEECRVTLYDDDGFAGQSYDLGRGDHPTGPWNDKITSLKVFGPKCVLRTYVDSDYNGQEGMFPAGEYDLSSMEKRGLPNDAISSLKVAEEALKFTPLDTSSGGDAIFFDRHNLACDANQYMSTWQLRTPDFNHIQFVYTCGDDSRLSSCVQLATPENDAGGGDVRFFDRHTVECNENRVISQWKYATPRGGTMKFEYTCCSLENIASLECRTLATGWATSENGDSRYLDRHAVECQSHEAMTKWHLSTSGNDMRVEYTCCQPTTATPTALPTPKPTAAPSVSPTPTPTAPPTTTACAWRQTGDCSPTGPREPELDKSCSEQIPIDHSGYCDCNGNGAMDEGDHGYNCDSTPNSCAEVCQGCDESLSGDGADYRGCQDRTITGRICQKWTSQSPHTHVNTVENKPDSGLGNHNYCRNPDGHHTIWCYTLDPDVRFEECSPQPAAEQAWYEWIKCGYPSCIRFGYEVPAENMSHPVDYAFATAESSGSCNPDIVMLRVEVGITFHGCAEKGVDCNHFFFDETQTTYRRGPPPSNPGGRDMCPKSRTALPTPSPATPSPTASAAIGPSGPVFSDNQGLTVVENSLGTNGGSMQLGLPDGGEVVVTNQTEYSPFDASVVGLVADVASFAQLSLACGTSVTMLFSFPETIDELNFTIADLDEGTHGRCGESVHVTGYSNYSLYPTADSSSVQLTNGRFVATTPGTADDNPQFLDMTEGQKKKAVTFMFDSTKDFLVVFSTAAEGVTAADPDVIGYAGRRILFGFGAP